MTGPLEGLRIVEIGEGPAVAFAGRNFSDLGAEVVKVEAVSYTHLTLPTNREV